MKLKTFLTLATLAVMVTVLATATTASANFEATTAGATSGPATFPAISTFNEGEAEIICRSTTTSKATGFWTIQTSEETVVNNVTKGGGTKEQKQPPTKRGPHESITIEKWGACEAVAVGTHLPAEVSPCRLQIIQPPGITKIESTAKIGSIQTDCVVVIKAGTLTCTLTVPQTKVNHELTGVSISNEGANQVLAKSNVTGQITAKATGGLGCNGLPEITKGASFKTGANGGEAINLHEQTMV